MAPERINSQSYSFSSDVWAFALSVLTVAMGHFPYDEASGYWGLVRAIANEPSPNVKAVDGFSSEIIDFFDQVRLLTAGAIF
jgi:serine/threonine protein kinase